eukprot:CAMPEP_0178968296 /NCGR_PEP_ID=MMETSP0789-20121207/18146_1 /TAXON_ID=3005 /ORGANISM="Rhizosolenia setigera, Strain CCMP 1694" /LENGTH=106 /DNA_ID=CAMNT_0020654151 /DNA_START=409 /DNA_END=726 /DNA_ORIENTATION=-
MIHPQLEAFLEKTESFLSKYPFLSEYEKLKDLEEKTGYNKVYIFFLGLFLDYLSPIPYFLGVAKLVTDLVSFVYPAYMSFKAIDSGNVTVDTQWLTDWVVFAFISI